jgi:hypothetical protein
VGAHRPRRVPVFPARGTPLNDEPVLTSGIEEWPGYLADHRPRHGVGEPPVRHGRANTIALVGMPVELVTRHTSGLPTWLED